MYFTMTFSDILLFSCRDAVEGCLHDLALFMIAGEKSLYKTTKRGWWKRPTYGVCKTLVAGAVKDRDSIGSENREGGCRRKQRSRELELRKSMARKVQRLWLWARCDGSFLKSREPRLYVLESLYTSASTIVGTPSSTTHMAFLSWNTVSQFTEIVLTIFITVSFSVWSEVLVLSPYDDLSHV